MIFSIFFSYCCFCTFIIFFLAKLNSFLISTYYTCFLFVFPFFLLNKNTTLCFAIFHTSFLIYGSSFFMNANYFVRSLFFLCVAFKVDFSLLFLLYFYWFIPSRWFPFLFNNTGATTRTTAIIILLLVKLIFGCWLVSFCDRLDGSLIYLIFQILSLFYGGERADRRIVKHNGTRRRWQELMKKRNVVTQPRRYLDWLKNWQFWASVNILRQQNRLAQQQWC